MDNKLGEKIREKRKQMGLTLKELAADRVTAAQISAVEKGKCKPSQSLLIYIADRLNTDVEYFTQSDEDRYRKYFEKCKNECIKLLEDKNYDEVLHHMEELHEILGYLDDQQKGYYYYISGNIYYDKLQYKIAFNNYINALIYYLKTKDINTALDISIKTGNCLCNTGQYDLALSYYIDAGKYIDDKINCNIAARILYDESVCYIKLERYEPARESTKKCFDYINSHNIEGKEKFTAGLNMIKGIIDLKYDKDKKEASLQNFTNAFEKYKKENNIVGMGRAVNNTGTWYSENGNHQKAIECFYDAVKYKTEGRDETLSDSYINLAEEYRDAGNMDKAMEVINKAEEVMLNEDNSKGLIDVMMEKFGFIIGRGDYDKAEMYAFILLDCIQKFSDKKSEEKLYFKMSDMYKKLGDEKSSIQYLLKANNLITPEL